MQEVKHVHPAFSGCGFSFVKLNSLIIVCSNSLKISVKF